MRWGNRDREAKNNSPAVLVSEGRGSRTERPLLFGEKTQQRSKKVGEKKVSWKGNRRRTRTQRDEQEQVRRNGLDHPLS